jgi:hypothetical protein
MEEGVLFAADAGDEVGGTGGVAAAQAAKAGEGVDCGFDFGEGVEG